LSDNRFSIDDILNEYPKHDNSHKSNEPFDLDSFLSSSYSSKKEEVVTAEKDNIKKDSNLSSIASEIKNIEEKNAPESEKPVFIKKKNNDDINIVIGQRKSNNPPEKKIHNKKIIAEKEPEELDAFDTIESINNKSKNAVKSEKRKAKKKERQEKRKRELLTESHTEQLEALKENEKQEQIQKEQPVKKSFIKEATGFFERPKKNQDNSDGKLSFEGKDIKPVQHGRVTGNTEIIDSLMRIKKERGSRTSLINAIPRKSISDIDLNLDDIILPNTEQIPISNDNIEIQKLKELKERRKKKINDFVLVGDEEDDDDETEKDNEEIRDISDFEKFEDAPSILNDIIQLKGSLIVRLCFLIVTALASIYISFANDFNISIIEILSKQAQPTTYLFINIILGLLSSFVSYTVISCGITKLFKFQADCDSISALSIISSLLSAMISLASPGVVSNGIIHIYISVSVTSLLFNTIGKLLIVGRTAKNFKYISGDYDRYAVFNVTDEEKASLFTRGTINDFPYLASMRKTEFISDFLKNSYSTDITDKFCKILVPVIFLASLLIAVISVVLNGITDAASGLFIGLASFTGCISLCSCFAIMLVINLPMYRATKKYLEESAAILSYQSVEEFSDTNSILVDVAQLFPQGMINLSAIKIFSDTRIDEAIVEAASLTNQAGSILKHMFYDIIAGKTEMLNPVESYIYEDSMGICGWINNKRVLLGNRELMINHSIEGMPTKIREKEYTENGKSAVYLSISGELSAMFIVELKASLEVQKWLKQLEKNRIYVMLRSVDSIISINRLADLFDISPDMLKILPFRLHQSFEEVTSYTPRQSASLACIGRFPSFASLIVGTKRIRKIANMGMAIQVATVILGLLLCLTFTLLSSFNTFTPTLILLYNLAWALITVTVQGLKRT